jgi:hypothetical protein
MFCGCCNKRRKGQEDWLCECSHINLAVDPRCAKCEKPSLTVEIFQITSEQSKKFYMGEMTLLRRIGQRIKNPFGYDEAGELEDL